MVGEPQVLIVGAGPTGLMLALRLQHHGVPFRIIDKNSGPGLASRAMVIQARSLEFYDQLGFAGDLVARGIPLEAAHVFECGKEVASFPLHDIGAGITAYPFPLCFPQDDHEKFLVARLQERGVEIEYGVALTAFEQKADGVDVHLQHDATTEEFHVAYVCGCDGAHDVLREPLGITFPGGTYEQLFYVADVRVDEPSSIDLLMHFAEHAFVLMLPVRSSGMKRLIGIVPLEFDGRNDVKFETFRPSVEAMLGIAVREVNWFSTYRVHHRVASNFRVDRVFLLGDAGHLHSPVAGQGMNTGLGDAVNLAWKLSDTLQGRAADSVLDSYEHERITFAQKLVSTTDRIFETISGQSWTSEFVRTKLIPTVFPALSQLPIVRTAVFKTVSQIGIDYHDSPLSSGTVGHVRGGDRLPWTGSNYASLRAMDWRVHVYGDVAPGFATKARALGIAVDAFAFDDTAKNAGFAKDAAYLLRPDGYIGAAFDRQDHAELLAYANSIGLRAP